VSRVSRPPTGAPIPHTRMHAHTHFPLLIPLAPLTLLTPTPTPTCTPTPSPRRFDALSISPTGTISAKRAGTGSDGLGSTDGMHRKWWVGGDTDAEERFITDGAPTWGAVGEAAGPIPERGGGRRYACLGTSTGEVDCLLSAGMRCTFTVANSKKQSRFAMTGCKPIRLYQGPLPLFLSTDPPCRQHLHDGIRGCSAPRHE